MKERPILFNGEMVRAVMRPSNPKTQTRRVMKPQPPCECAYVINGDNNAALCYYEASEAGNTIWVPPTPNSEDHRLLCPYGGPGDRLWVRETFTPDPEASVFYLYRADYPGEIAWDLVWKPSIFMPRHACRTLLEVVSVRVERLQDISEEDAKAEGCKLAETVRGRKVYHASYRAAFASLWQVINGVGSWDDNPWVWVVEFKRL